MQGDVLFFLSFCFYLVHLSRYTLISPYHAHAICRKDLSAAIWRPEHQAAEVVLQRGRLYNYMGFTWGKKIFLHIEEVVYVPTISHVYHVYTVE